MRQDKNFTFTKMYENTSESRESPSTRKGSCGVFFLTFTAVGSRRHHCLGATNPDPADFAIT